MSATPVGYGSFSGLRRKSVTLLCVLLASTTAMGITVYVDSYSIHEWTKLVDTVGPISMTVSDDQGNVTGILDDIREMTGIESAETIKYANGQMMNRNDSDRAPWNFYPYECRIGIPSEDYVTKFQGAFELITGHLPETENEVVLHHWFATQLNARVGDIVNYTQEQGMVIVLRNFEVTGIYSLMSDNPSSFPGAGTSTQILNAKGLI